MLSNTENECVLLIVIFLLLCCTLYLLKKNSILKNTIRLERMTSQSQERMEERFKNISNEILIRNHQSFLNIAKETFDKVLNQGRIELDKKQDSFLNLINPIQNTLKSFDDKISQIEKDRIDSYSDLRRQLKDMMLYQQDLQKETEALNKALSSPGIAGHWGEMQLRRVVEIAGMVPHCDFFEQQQEENSRRRPDMVIRLPGGRNIVVDAKTPIGAYMQAVNTGSSEFLKSHADNVKRHIKSLSLKSYWEQFSPTPEFVLMFLPGESFFSSAVKTDPTLIEFGVQERVIIVTPITLIALLKTISFSWSQAAIAENAKKIGEVGRSVCNYLEELIDRTIDFEKRMKKNSEEFERIGSFIEKKIAPAALKLKSLGLEVSHDSHDELEVH